ncbi:MAG: hypothetical protein ACLSUW_04800 [Akkermansia sp.]
MEEEAVTALEINHSKRLHRDAINPVQIIRPGGRSADDEFSSSSEKGPSCVLPVSKVSRALVLLLNSRMEASCSCLVGCVDDDIDMVIQVNGWWIKECLIQRTATPNAEPAQGTGMRLP